MRIYISGAITGHDDYMERFRRAEMKLKAEGHQVFNPARIFEMVQTSIGWELKYESLLAADLAMLQSCDAIYFLRGYEYSNGARTEMIKARQLGLTELFEEELP